MKQNNKKVEVNENFMNSFIKNFNVQPVDTFNVQQNVYGLPNVNRFSVLPNAGIGLKGVQT